jgi:hypothetical protein
MVLRYLWLILYSGRLRKGQETSPTWLDEAGASCGRCLLTYHPRTRYKYDSRTRTKREILIAYIARTDLGAVHNIGAPIHVYPLYENGFRAHRGQSLEENNQESAELYAEFAQVAESNPLAWNHGSPADTADKIGTITAKNRMICLPCKI